MQKDRLATLNLDILMHHPTRRSAIDLAYAQLSPWGQAEWDRARPGTSVTRDGLVGHLNAARIGTRNLFGGNLTRQPYMIGRDFRVVGDLTASDRVMNDTFWVGVYPGLSDAHIDHIAERIGAYCQK